MINAIIIDDERRSRAFLRSLLETHTSDITIVGDAEDIPSSISCIRKEDPDLIFLDIQLRDGTGFDILNHFPHPDFKVIFTTAYDQYAIDAFKVYAIDYLLKPIDKGQLSNAILKAKREIQFEKKEDHLDQLIKYLRKDQHRIIISTESSYDFIQVKDILRFEADGSYTKIFLKDGVQKITSKNLKEYHELLAERGFFRVHHSHLISLDEVVSVTKTSSGDVTLSDGSIVPISRRRKEQFLQALKMFRE